MTNLSYEICKELRDAGFPQSGKGEDLEPRGWRDKHHEGYLDSMVEYLSEKIYSPTLSELIAECGDDFYGLKKGGSIWVVESIQNIRGESKWIGGNFTPEVAVARLYLALHKK